MESKASPKHNQIKPPKFTDTENRLMAPRKWGGSQNWRGGSKQQSYYKKRFQNFSLQEKYCSLNGDGR